MRLNLPILDQLLACDNLLIAGMGGGFDIFCGLPIYFELKQRGKTVHLANFSFSFAYNNTIQGGQQLTDTLLGVNADIAGRYIYFPELYLSQWFREQHNQELTLWCFHRTGVQPLLKNYQALAKHLSLDGILLIDGGIDSLMRGDEARTGTLLEDSISLIAVDMLGGIETKLMGCIGFGIERQIAYAHVMENIAALVREGGFLGSCALVQQMQAYQLYQDAVLYVQDKPFQDPSVINSSIISATRGHYGDYHLTEKTHGSRLWISPLMPLYWFFDVAAVAPHSLLYSQLQSTIEFRSALHITTELMQLLPRRPYTKIPLE